MISIFSWNVNGYRSISGQNKTKRYDIVKNENALFQFIDKYNPDIICLQETKSSEADIWLELKAPNGYTSYFTDCKIKKGYSGVCVITKLNPLNINREIGIEEFDNEGRIIELEFDNFTLFNIYFPSGTSGEDRIDYKLRFYDAVIDYIDKIKINGKNIIILGDFNTAHKEIDIARPKENEKNSGFLPIERQKLDNLFANGYIDTFRQFNNEPHNYTWWSMRGSAKIKNIGWRIDYIVVSENLQSKLKSAKIYPEISGSDHCPLSIELDF